jgi:hypothetical protein
MCTSVDIVWKSHMENFGFEAGVRVSLNSCAIFTLSLSCQKNFLIGGKGTLHGRPLSRRMHKRFLETYALSKKKT